MIDQLSAIALRATSFLSAPPTPPPGKGAEWGKAAPVGLLVILLLCVAVWLLLRSMSKHLRKVREFGEQEQAEREPPAGIPDVSEDAAGADRSGSPAATASAAFGAPEGQGPSVDGPRTAVDPPR